MKTKEAAVLKSAATPYDRDVILWAQEQSALLRAGRFAELDIEHIADEIEDVGKAEKREFASRMAVLLAHLMKWKFQPERRGRSWRLPIADQRERIALAIEDTPSLKYVMRAPSWQRDAWLDARAQARNETGIDDLPENCPWPLEQAMDREFWPDWPALPATPARRVRMLETRAKSRNCIHNLVDAPVFRIYN
ncbi:MAG: DUF29 domain-containing protein [Roseiarcus sp.]